MSLRRRITLGVVVAVLIAASAAAASNGWGQTRRGAENNLQGDGYTLAGHDAISIRCEGIWASGARRLPHGVYLFARLWCELRFPSAFWHVKYEQTGRNTYKLTGWACGRIGRTCSTGSTSRVCTANAHVLHLSGVSCDTATSVYFAFISGGDTGDWTCTGRASFGSCSDATGLSIDEYASFRWS